MHEVSVTRTVGLSAADAWAILDDFGSVYRYHPLVAESPIINGIPSGLGARRVCHFHDGNAITEEVVEHEDGHRYAVEIVEFGNFPLHRARGTISVRPLGDATTEVRFDMAFQPKFGPIGWLMGKTVMAAQFKKVLGQVLDGLDQHGRTGEVVGPRPRPAAA